uniref:TIL domain-containing protein n=1 Tax=Panagrolaimus superbus TaxID=310955 RepID=A0A914YHY2_9BILA
MKQLYIATVFLMLVFAAFSDAKCPSNEHLVTRLCCNKSCEVANLPKNKRCKWPCAKVAPQCHCNRTFFRHKNGNCVPKAQC